MFILLALLVHCLGDFTVSLWTLMSNIKSAKICSLSKFYYRSLGRAMSFVTMGNQRTMLLKRSLHSFFFLQGFTDQGCWLGAAAAVSPKSSLLKKNCHVSDAGIEPRQ